MAELFAKYSCTNCQDDIPGVRVHCAECPSFDLCLQCFASGAEIGNHRSDHAYQLVDNGTSSLTIFRGKNAWSAREELRLLDAVEMYGYGNWEDISKHIETRSAEDAKEEYINKYLNGTIGRHTWQPVSESQRPHVTDQTVDEDSGPLGENHLHKLPPLDITPEEAAQLGYMPNRDEFEREYDPTAEKIVTALTLNSNEKDIDVILKLAQLDIYTRRLRERARRKRLVKDYQLVANFFRGTHKALQLTREQRDFRDRFRVFAQFYTSYEYERLLASIERERELRIRLSELNRYRWNGLTKIDECVHFEQHAAAMPYKNTGPYGHGKTDNQSVGSRHGSSSHSQPNSSKRGNESTSASDSVSTAPNPMHRTGDQAYSDASLPSKSCLDSYRGSSGQSTSHLISTTAMTTMTSTTTAPTSSSNNSSYLTVQQSQQLQQAHQQQQQINQGSIAGAASKSQQQPPVGAANPSASGNSNLPMKSQLLAAAAAQQQPPAQLGENLLTSKEKELCSSLNLTPTAYFSLKTVLLSRAPVSNSPVENHIRKYFIKVGWLSH